MTSERFKYITIKIDNNSLFQEERRDEMSLEFLEEISKKSVDLTKSNSLGVHNFSCDCGDSDGADGGQCGDQG